MRKRLSALFVSSRAIQPINAESSEGQYEPISGKKTPRLLAALERKATNAVVDKQNQDSSRGCYKNSI